MKYEKSKIPKDKMKNESRDDMRVRPQNFEGIRFYDGSRYEGTWNALGMDGIGRYIFPHDVKLEGEFRDDTFHGQGIAHWPRGQRMYGVWSQGECKENRYNFTDGLIFLKNGWKYCQFPDRRYYICLKYGLRPAGATLRINKEKGTMIPPSTYDAGIGIFNTRTHCIASYRNPSKIVEIPTATFARWIVNNCQKGWTEPTGHRRSLYEHWIPGKNDANVCLLSPLQSLPKSCFESWWKRLTTFQQNCVRRTDPSVSSKRHIEGKRCVSKKEC